MASMLSRRLPLAFSYWLGQRVADVYYMTDPAGRQGVASNLRRILAYRGVHPPGGDVRSLVRKTYQQFGKYIVDFYRYSRSSYAELEPRIGFERRDYFDAVAGKGKPAILVTGHIGNWEMGGLVLGCLGRPVTAVYRPTGVPHVDRLWRYHRLRRGIHLLSLGSAVGGLLRALANGQLVSLLVDRDFTHRGRPIRFFGAEVPMPVGAAVLSLRTGAPILPAFLIRQIDDRFLLRFYEPVEPSAAGGVGDIQQRVVAALEDVIGEVPVQWFVFRDFWGSVEAGPPRQGDGA